MNNVTAFSETQADFLTSVANARPRYWEYECRVCILDAHRIGEIDDIRTSLIEARDKLKRGILDLPPQRNLSQYFTADSPSLLWYRIGDNGNRILDHLPISGSDPHSWLNAAYENAHELLTIADELIQVCLSAESFAGESALFELDPPLKINDTRVQVIERYIHHFNDLNATDVLRVFDARKGKLSMKSDTRWKNSMVVEAIRKGLNLQPKVLCDVTVQHADGTIESWMTDGKPQQNRFGAHVNAARTKAFQEFDTFEEEATALIQSLSRLISS